MIQVPQSIQDIINGDARTFRVTFSIDGQPIPGDLGVVKFYRGASGRKPGPGTIYVPYVEAEVRDCTVALEGKTITAQLGVLTSKDPETFHWIDFGTYVVSKPEVAGRVTNFRAIGTLGTIGSQPSQITQSYPLDVATALSEIEQGAGKTIRTIGVSGTGTMTTGATGSWRDVTSFIAEFLGGFLTEDVNGDWVIAAYGSGSTVSVAADRSQEPPQYGEQSYEISGQTFESCVAELAMGNPLIDPWDRVVITDLASVTHTIAPLQMVHSIDGGLSTAIDAAVENEVEEQATVVGPMQRQIDAANNNANTALSTAEEVNTIVSGGNSVGFETAGSLQDDNVTVIADTFAQAVGDAGPGTYTFTYDGTIWSLGGEQVDIEQFGIYLDEEGQQELANGDVLTITYSVLNGFNSQIGANASEIDALQSQVNDIEGSIGDLENSVSDVEANQTATTQNVNQLQADYVALQASVNSEKAERAARMVFGTDSQGNPELIISGGQNEALQTVFTNAEIQFLDSGEKVAYITGQTMFIKTANVTERLQFGSFAFIPRANDNLCLKYIGV